MKLREKFLAVMIFLPSICLGLFLYFAVSTFVADRTSAVIENQLQLLNSAALLLGKLSAEELERQYDQLTKQDGFENLLVVDSRGKIRYALQGELKTQNLADAFSQNLAEKLASQSNREGGFETLDHDGNRILASFYGFDSGSESLALLLTRPKSAATRASLLFLFRALASFAALIALAVIVSLWFSNRLTSGIVQLSQAMVAFGRGEADTALPPPLKDEIGQMSRQFQLMRTQIRLLFAEQAEKTRFETEMNLAGELQRRFFPRSEFEAAGVEFSGYIEPASNAGGDWWYYFLADGKFVFLIGDVTGHGLNSAMLTGMSRSAFSLIESAFPGPAQSMKLLNRAIFESTLNELNMTCCICCLDLDTGNLTWCNASHEAPIVVPAISGALKANDFGVVTGSDGPRLGEARDVEYTERSMQLSDGEKVFLYSDGLSDLQDSEGKALGDRHLLRSLGKDCRGGESANDLLHKIKQIAFKHRGERELVDDLSFLVVKWKKTV